MDSECCCGTEDGSYVGGIYYVIYHGYACGSVADGLYGGVWLAMHGAEYATGEGVACELGEELACSCVDGYARALLYDVGGIALDVTFFAEERVGLVACLECHTDYFGAFGYEESVQFVVAIA